MTRQALTPRHAPSLRAVAPPDDCPAPMTLRSGSLAIVHDWCPDFRGGERVLAELCRLGPRAEVFTLFDFLSTEVKREHFPDIPFTTSIADSWPAVRHYYRALFFLCPFLIEQFDVTNFDVVVSSSAAFARGVITRPDQPHVCYVHSPIRYAWDEQFSYLAQARLGFGPMGLFYRACLHGLRTWDARTAHGPDALLANSRYVKARIKRVYGRNAQVVAPPVAIDELSFEARKDDYYVTAAFLAPYKRTDLVVEAFRAMPQRRLIVIGDGQQLRALRNIATPNITFAGHLPRRELIRLLSLAKAFVFAGCEDFGITLAEAQGCGTSVIAFARGGAADIVVPPHGREPGTGLLFPRQSAAMVKAAIEEFEDRPEAFAPSACRLNAERFAPQRFLEQVHAAIDRVCEVKRRQLGLA